VLASNVVALWVCLVLVLECVVRHLQRLGVMIWQEKIEGEVSDVGSRPSGYYSDGVVLASMSYTSPAVDIPSKDTTPKEEWARVAAAAARIPMSGKVNSKNRAK